MSRAVCLRLRIGRQCFDVQRDSARAQAAAPIVGEIVKSHLVLRAFSERPYSPPVDPITREWYCPRPEYLAS